MTSRLQTSDQKSLLRHERVLLILLCALIAIVPQKFRGLSCGHDFDFHLVSWLDALGTGGTASLPAVDPEPQLWCR